MKTFLAGLQASVSSGSYDKTKTSALGRAFQKTISGSQVIGPALSGFLDVQTLAGFAPGYMYFVPGQNLLFVFQASTAASMSVAAFNFNSTTGVNSYIGKLTLNFANSAATTNTIRGVVAWSDGTNVRLMVGTTGSVVPNSGIYLAYTTLSAFTVAGTQLYAASGSGQNAIYLLHPGDYYGANAATGFISSLWGLDYAYLSPTAAVNTKLFAMANTVAAPTVLEWDLATPPTVAGSQVNGITSISGGFATNTTVTCYLSMASNPGYAGGTTYEPVCFQAGTAAVATGLTAWASGTLQSTTNVYFTRDVQQLWTITCTALTTGISAGSTYTNNGLTFTVVQAAIAGATSFIATLPQPTVPGLMAAPTSSGTFTRATGTGDASITFSSAVAGLVYFNVGATSGGAAVLLTSSNVGFSMFRAFGTSTNQFVGRTPLAGFTPALTATLLQTSILQYARPTFTPANTALQGQDCLAVATSANVYMGKISDLFVTLTGAATTFNSVTVTVSSTTGVANGMAVVGPGIPPGATVSSFVANTSITLSVAATATASGLTLVLGNNVWSSFTTANILGTGIDIVAPTAALARYGGQGLSIEADKWIINTNTSSFVMKALQNNAIFAYFGGVNVSYYETLNPVTVQTGVTALVAMENRAGWLFLAGSGTGQRGVIYADIASDGVFGYSAVISPVLTTAPGSTFKYINAVEKLFDLTDSAYFWIRSSSANDSTFSAANIPTPSNPNGWTQVFTAADLSSFVIGPYFQLCCTYELVSYNAQTPPQIQDIAYTVQLPGEASSYWAPSVENSTQSGVSPMYVAWRLQTAYATSVPTLYVRGYDDAGNLVASFNTSSNASSFSYTTNNGTSWNALGTIPNTALTTEVRVNIATPPSATRINWSLSES